MLDDMIANQAQRSDAVIVGGGMVGLTSASVGFLPALGVMAAVGLGYGVLLRVLARRCYLPIPGAA